MGLDRYMQETFPGRAIYPEQTHCPDCDCELRTEKTKAKCMFITSITQYLDIYTAQCVTSGCSNKHYFFQGRDLAIINWQNRILITMEYALDYLGSFASSGQPTSSWWENKCVNQLGYEHSDQRMKESLGSKAGHLAEAMAGTAELLNFKQGTFKCCENPLCVSMDGTVISIARMRMPELSRPWQDPSPHNQRATTRRRRQLPQLSKQMAAIVSKFAYEPEGISTSDLTRLRNCGHVGVALFACLANSSNNRHRCHREVREFATCLLSEIAPAILIVPPALFATVQALAETGPLLSVECRNRLMQESPMLFSLFTGVMRHANNEATWLAMSSLSLALLQLAEYTVGESDSGAYTNLSEEALQSLPTKNYSPPNSDLHELWETGTYFPGRPVIRTVKHIPLAAKDEGVTCSKAYNEGGRCSQGVILVYCVEHSNCIGFIVQNQPESPRVVYELLLSRFRVPPKIVMYDNGCNLHEYVLNRAPVFFKDTYFLVDGFHANSHKNCMAAYDTTKYLNMCRGLNSSLLEQKNARFTKLKTIAPLQRFRSFVAFFRFAVAKNNLDQWRKNQHKKYKRSRRR
jgi:hypothetical protein